MIFLFGFKNNLLFLISIIKSKSSKISLPNIPSYSELDSSTIEFIYNLNSLKDGNTLTEISKAPTDEIAKQLSKVEILWNDFHKNIDEFKKLVQNKDNDANLKDIVNYIYNTNTNLLKEVDTLVSMYTTHTEQKSDYLRYIQYISHY